MIFEFEVGIYISSSNLGRMSVQAETPLELSESHEELVMRLMTDIRSGKLERSDKVALATLSVLEQIINDYSDEDPMRCVCALRAASRRVCACVSARGAATRLLREYRAAHHKECGGAWLRALVAPPPPPPPPPVSVRPHVVPATVSPIPTTVSPTSVTVSPTPAPTPASQADYLLEVRSEVESSFSVMRAALCAQGGAERATLVCPRAARAAADVFTNTVVLPAIAQWGSGALALSLSQCAARVRVVSLASALVLAPRLDKVVLWGVAGGAGGAALAARGTRALAAAARTHNVPVLVLCPLQQLCPTHLEPACGVGGGGADEEELDLIPADLITLFVTNIGCVSPSYMYRLMSELYDPSDYDL